MASSKKLYYLENARVGRWLEALMADNSVFVPAETRGDEGAGPDYCFRRLSGAGDFCFNPYRATDPLKSFFTPYIERVAEYFDGDDVAQEEKTSVVFGVKACDLAAHRVQDYVFLQGVAEDPFYKLKRDSTILISGDCPDFKDVCFCLAMNGAPYPESGFDLNLSPIDGEGFVVEPGSARGEGLIEEQGELFVAAGEDRAARRESNREEVVKRLREHLQPQNLPACGDLQAIVKGGMEKDTWDRFATTCVECGGCNFICDTCHCFLLSDKKAGSVNQKIRLWDSCQYRKFATVAGGATPLKTRSERLRNRFLKKFDFFVENMNEAACCGCGRCIEVCPGEIDLREVFKDLEKNG